MYVLIQPRKNVVLGKWDGITAKEWRTKSMTYEKWLQYIAIGAFALTSFIVVFLVLLIDGVN